MTNGTERRLVILLPIYAIGLGIFLQYSGLELLIVSPFYDSENAIWPLKDYWLTQSVLHIFAQHLMKVFGLSLLGIILYLSFTKKNPPLRKMLGCGFLAMAAGLTVVGYLKGQTRLYCPWDLEVFG
jgi:membrane-associated PAP2 superfamily phosphatase